MIVCSIKLSPQIELVVGGLGLPAQTTGAFIIGFLRRDYGTAGLFHLARDGVLSTFGLTPCSIVQVTQLHPTIIFRVGETEVSIDVNVAREIIVQIK